MRLYLPLLLAVLLTVQSHIWKRFIPISLFSCLHTLPPESTTAVHVMQMFVCVSKKWQQHRPMTLHCNHMTKFPVGRVQFTQVNTCDNLIWHIQVCNKLIISFVKQLVINYIYAVVSD